jgi:phosphonate transport system substrate-binding protein
VTALSNYRARRAYLSDLRDDLKLDIATAFADGPTKDKAAFDRLPDGKDEGFVAVGRKDYADIVKMRKSAAE